MENFKRFIRKVFCLPLIVLWKFLGSHVCNIWVQLLTFINIFVKTCFELNCRFDIWHQVLSTTYILLFLISGKNGDDDDLEDWLNDYLSWTYDAICPHQQPTVFVLTKNRPSEFFLFFYKITSALENNKIVIETYSIINRSVLHSW